ncbi:MAG: hypothetical protein LBT62_02350 [Deltaproteobacteria bacterium]|jgi:hypothetical protein|nr:hypothetical protein [Deltaproteobacteria bacterium]
MTRTRDVDLLVRNQRKPPHKTDFLDKMQEAGFIIDASEISGMHRFMLKDFNRSKQAAATSRRQPQG